MSDNQAFCLLAIGHYGAQDFKVEIHLQSQRAATQLLELDYLEEAIHARCAALREELQRAAAVTASA